MKRPLKGGRYTRNSRTGRLTKVKTKEAQQPPPPPELGSDQSDTSADNAGKGNSK